MTHNAAGQVEELLPCPFCGGDDLKLHEDFSEDEPRRAYAWHVFCQNCHCHGRNNFPIGWAETQDEAVTAWNRRTLTRRSASTGVKSELVAWRWKWAEQGDWYFGPKKPERIDADAMFLVEPLYASPVEQGVTDLTLDEEELDTILAVGRNEQSGRVTKYELDELVRVYRAAIRNEVK